MFVVGFIWFLAGTIMSWCGVIVVIAQQCSVNNKILMFRHHEDTLKNANVKCFCFCLYIASQWFPELFEHYIFNVCSLNNYVLFYMKGSK